MAEENQISLDTKYSAVENVIMEIFKYSKETSTDIRKKLVDSTQKDGRVPDGWQVHHKLPLDDSGTNSFDNLVLIKNEP